MSEHQVQNWHVRKPLARSRGGVVASQSRVAAEVGARVLAGGGNAVDAAVATGFALAAVEPWNSGLGGIGFMLVYPAKKGRVSVVDFGPISPRALDPDAYPLIGGGAMTRDLFTWPAVKDDRNVHGPLSIAVPGHPRIELFHDAGNAPVFFRRCGRGVCHPHLTLSAGNRWSPRVPLPAGRGADAIAWYTGRKS